MNISQIQSQLAINRNNINRLHNHIWLIKYYLRIKSVDTNEIPTCIKDINNYSKKIAQLVVLQKTLKKDLKSYIIAEKLYKDVENLKSCAKLITKIKKEC